MPNLKAHVVDIVGNDDIRVEYMPMGIDLDEINLKSKNWIIPNGKFIVGYAGSIGIANQVEDMLEATELTKSNDTIYYAILGDGPLKEDLREKYSHLNNVIWFERVDKIYVNSFLEKCNLLINSWKDIDIYRYGVSPNKWIDYMYAGNPMLVAYNGYKSIVNEAGCGEFIEAENPEMLAQKITEYSKKDSKELAEMGAKGKKYLLENLNYAKLARDYLEFIMEEDSE